MQAATSSKSDNVYNILEERIRDGVWPLDCVIPAEVELASEFGCSRSTIGKAIARLVHEGLVVRKTRAGTRVVRSSPDRGRSTVELDAVAFIYPSEQHEGIHRIVRGFQEAAHAVQRRVVLLSTGTDYRKEGEIIGRLGEFDVKGAVVYPVLPEPKDRLYFAQMLQACRFPIVVVDASMPGFGVPAVEVDGFHAGYTMTRYLLARGLRKIGFLANGSWVPSVQNRYGGYRWALEEAGIEAQPGWAVLEPSMHPDFEHPLEKTQKLTTQFLENARGLEGVVCSDDFLALSCLASARELGLRVPEDLKVVGHGDYAVSTQQVPSLTTYHVPFEEIGRKVFQMLNALLNSRPIPELETRIRGEIVIRQSA